MPARFAQSSGATGANGGTSISMSVTVGAGQNLLIACVMIENGNTPTVTFGGIAMTRVANQYNVIHIFVLFNPPAGTYTLAASWAGSCHVHLMSASYTGAGTFGTPVLPTGGSGWVRCNVTTPTNGCVIAYAYIVNQFTVYPDANVNVRATRWQDYTQSFQVDWIVAGTNNLGFTHQNADHAMVAIPLSEKPPAAGNQVLWF
jgi:hypothetical protein